MAALQTALALCALLIVAFVPPLHGRTLLVPIKGQLPSDELIGQSLLTRVGPGPLPGSIVVEGPGRPLATTLLGRGILMLAAPAALCRDPVLPKDAPL